MFSPEHERLSPMVDLQQAVNERLRECRSRQLDHVQCVTRGREIILTGEVPTYYAKQLAQTLVRQVTGIGQIVNEITVRLNS